MEKRDRRWTIRQVGLILILAGGIAAALAVFGGGGSANSVPPPQQSGPFSILSIITIFPTTTTNLNLTISGNGAGNIVSDTNGNDSSPINCSRAANATTGDCADAFDWVFFAPTVTLTATAQAGSNFIGWTVNPAGAVSAGCGLAATCSVIMSSDVSVSTSFTQAPGTQPLAVLKSGAGQGTVTSAPAGINCGATCTANYAGGTVVTLTAAANPGSTFGGWTGAGCTGTGTCIVTMNSPQTVTANFTTQTFPLVVTVSGSGAVASNPVGIGCPSTCSASFASGTSVVLTAAAAQGASFNGWSGAGCSGTGTCTVSMTQAQNVTATFVGSTPPPPTRVQASVTSVNAGRANGQRVVRVRVNALEEITVRVVVRQNGNRIGSTTDRGFGPGRGRVTTTISGRARNRSANVTITLSASGKQSRVVTRTVTIPA